MNQPFFRILLEIEKLRGEINDFKTSLEFTENVLQDKITKVEDQVTKLQSNIFKAEEDINEVFDYVEDTSEIHDKLIELEDRSRRNNVRIDGVLEE